MIKSIYSFVRNCQTMFQSDWNILHPYNQWMRVPRSLHTCQQLQFNFWVLAILIVHSSVLTCFYFRLPNDKCFSAYFHILICHLYVPFVRYSDILPIKSLFFNCWIFKFLLIFSIQNMLGLCSLKKFISVCGLYFYSPKSFM